MNRIFTTGSDLPNNEFTSGVPGTGSVEEIFPFVSVIGPQVITHTIGRLPDVTVRESGTNENVVVKITHNATFTQVTVDFNGTQSFSVHLT